MGLSASQGRLLSLTSRLSDLEHRAQTISNQKIRMANETEEISKKYLDALNAKKLTAYNPDTNTHIDASLASLYKLNDCDANGTKRIIVDSKGNVVCPASVADKTPDYLQDYFNKTGTNYSVGKNVTPEDITNASANAKKAHEANVSAFGSEEAYLKFVFDGNVPTDENNETLKYFKNIYSGMEAFLQTIGYTTASNSVRLSEYYQGDVYAADGNSAYFSGDISTTSKIASSYNTETYGANIDASSFTNSSRTISKNESDTAWLYQQLSMGNLFIVEYKDNDGADGTGAWERISWSSGDPQLNTKNDDFELAKAEAEYEQAMNEVQAKDKRFDLELQTIDTEHNAIQTEIDSVNKVMDKNIDRTFKIFS